MRTSRCRKMKTAILAVALSLTFTSCKAPAGEPIAVAQSGSISTAMEASTREVPDLWPENWYEWTATDTTFPRIADIPAPNAFERLEVEQMSFAQWLRGLPLLPGRPEVHLFDGRRKGNQTAHYAIIDIDVGNRDLQQCADAVMRLRAEYLRDSSRDDEIEFHLTNGDLVTWLQWSTGNRPNVSGNSVSWRSGAAPSTDRRTFRGYLDFIFTYAGSASLQNELSVVSEPSRIRPGDVFIQGGFPGHAVIVVDVAESDRGSRTFLLAQSYMPAQQIHILSNPTDPISPWYRARSEGVLTTPEFTFSYTDLRRFPVEQEDPNL